MWWFESHSSETNNIQERPASRSGSNCDGLGRIEATSSTSLTAIIPERDQSGQTTSSTSLPARTPANSQTYTDISGQPEYPYGRGSSVKQDESELAIAYALDHLPVQRDDTERKQPVPSNYHPPRVTGSRETDASNYPPPRVTGSRETDASTCLGASGSSCHVCTRDVSVGNSVLGVCMGRDEESRESSEAGSRQGGGSEAGSGRVCLENGRVTWSDITIGSVNTNSVTTESAVCRICHEGGQREVLVSPCYCAGTMGLLHVSCLQTWLGLSNHTGCEICNFQFSLIRKPKPFTEFLRNPGSVRDKRNMIVDIIAFLLVTPLTIFTSWICIEGALKYYKTMEWEQAGLITLSAILYTVYVVWFVIMLVHYYGMWKTWRIFHQDVTLICKPSPMSRTETDINSHNLRAQPSSESMSSKSVQLSSITINVHGPAVRKSAYARGKSDSQCGSSLDSHSLCSRLKPGTSSNSSWAHSAHTRFRSPSKSHHGSKSKESGHGQGYVFEETKCRKLHASKDRLGGAQRSVSVSSRSTSPKLWSTKSPGVRQARCGRHCVEYLRGNLRTIRDATHGDKQSIGRKLANWDKRCIDDSDRDKMAHEQKPSSGDEVLNHSQRAGQHFQRFYSKHGHQKCQTSRAKIDNQSRTNTPDGEAKVKHDKDIDESESIGVIHLQASQGRVEYVVSPRSETVQEQRSCDSALVNSGLQQHNSQEFAPPQSNDQDLRLKELKSQSLRLLELERQDLRLHKCVSESTRSYEQKSQPKLEDIPTQTLKAQELTSQKLKSYKLKSQIIPTANEPKYYEFSSVKQVEESPKCRLQHMSDGSRLHEPNSPELGLCHRMTNESKPYDSRLGQEELDVKFTKGDQGLRELKHNRGRLTHYRYLPDRRTDQDRSQVSSGVEKQSCDDNKQSCDGNMQSCDGNMQSCDGNMQSCDGNKHNCDRETRICDINTSTARNDTFICDARSNPLVHENNFFDVEIREGSRGQDQTVGGLGCHVDGSMQGVGCHVEGSVEGIRCHVEGSAVAVFSRGNSPLDGSDWMSSRADPSCDRRIQETCFGDGPPGTMGAMGCDGHEVVYDSDRIQETCVRDGAPGTVRAMGHGGHDVVYDSDRSVGDGSPGTVGAMGRGGQDVVYDGDRIRVGRCCDGVEACTGDDLSPTETHL